MRTADFDYHLPRELIAQQPAEPRDSARLLVVDRAKGEWQDRQFFELGEFLRPGDLLVLNDTRVMAARLFGHRPDTGGSVEALLVRPLTDTRWEALFRPARQARPARTFVFEAREGPLVAKIVERLDDVVVLDFDRPFDPATVGAVPLPPYITEYRGDPERYQTVYANVPGSAAAPTAGLHFTPNLLQSLEQAGVLVVRVTLNVGPGTFKPVTVDDPREHHLHAEYVAVPATTATAVAAAKREGRRVVAVGTTVVRTLEHLARVHTGTGGYEGWTSLRILPGDEFRLVDAMVTNFHLPRSTLLMLVAAFAGYDLVIAAYRHAIEQRYRFYSFGDAMLLV